MDVQFAINGMTCTSCEKKVTELLQQIKGVKEVTIYLDKKLAILKTSLPVSTDQVIAALEAYPKYTVGAKVMSIEYLQKKSWWQQYKPVLLIFFYLILICTAVQWNNGTFNWMQWMNHFMAGFFLVFSFFKLLNIKGFANSYAMYDIVAAKWKGWGYIYPFVECILGFAFLLQVYPLLTNIITFLVMGISLIGVLQSVWNKRKIKCACLGDVFNLPMSTVTIVEDGLMMAMSLVMLLQLIG